MPAPRRRKKKSRPTPMRAGNMAANSPELELTIDHLGARGDGVSSAEFGDKHFRKTRPVFVPFTLPGEQVRAKPIADRGEGVATELREILNASEDRIEPICGHFLACGGCSLQHMKPETYQAFKVSTLRQALQRVGLGDVLLHPLQQSPTGSRRRAALAARRLKDKVILGFHERESNRIIDVQECPVSKDEIVPLLPKLRTLLGDTLQEGQACDLTITVLEGGLDVALVLPEEPDLDRREAYSTLADDNDLARLSYRMREDVADDMRPLAARRDAVLKVGDFSVSPAPGGFLQATGEGERALQQVVAAALDGAGKALDLFSGVGTFSLLMAEKAQVLALDGDSSATSSLRRAADRAGLGDRLRTECRDLFSRPLEAHELEGYGLAVFDPPRAGAKEQTVRLAQSQIPTIVAVSCNPSTFARDARLLVDGGYELVEVWPVDQFLWSPHIELAALFRKSG